MSSKLFEFKYNVYPILLLICVKIPTPATKLEVIFNFPVIFVSPFTERAYPVVGTDWFIATSFKLFIDIVVVGVTVISGRDTGDPYLIENKLSSYSTIQECWLLSLEWITVSLLLKLLNIILLLPYDWFYIKI